MTLLVQFLLRLAFGLAIGMAITPPRQVSSGFYRNHLYVVLGLATLATLVVARFSTVAAWLAGGAAVLSYLGSVCWLYEARRPGIALLWLVAGCSLAAAAAADPPRSSTGVAWQTASSTRVPAPRLASSVEADFLPSSPGEAGASSSHDRLFHPEAVLGLRSAVLLRWASLVTSGLVLGITMAAMLLGHWYLNSPGMELAPLRRLLIVMAAVVVLQAALSAVGLVGQLGQMDRVSLSWLLFLVLRWSFGLIGVLILVGMAWQTLRIPNTQSATGILYVAVIGVFVGELTGQLLSAESAFPL